MTWPADAVLAATLLEAVLLLALRRRRGWPLSSADILAMLLPAVALLIALRLALAGAGTAAIALALSAAGLLHLADLRRRLKRPG